MRFFNIAMVIIALLMWWLATYLVIHTISPAFSAKTPQIQIDVDCVVIIGQMRNTLIEPQKAGAERLYLELDKAARQEWPKHFPFQSYDTYILKRMLDYIDLETSITEYGAYWDVMGCKGQRPW